MPKQKNKERGITLIALVVTIIVLIILAGVSIAMLVGENGIITQAQKAKEDTELAEKQEKEDMAKLETEMNEAITGIEVEQVTDENPGVLEGSGTDTNPYTINSIEDLVFFANDVTQGNTYEGEYVKLGLSLDFKSSKSYVNPFRTDYEKYGYNGELKTLLTTGEGFKPIGTTATKTDNTIKEGNFAGIFDGSNFVILNCYMNKDVTLMEESYGMAFFGRYLYGEIKNLGLVNVNYNLVNSSKECYTSGLTIYSTKDSKIYNCYVTGSIKQISKGTGNVNCSGISAYNFGKIESCHNSAEITGKINDSTLTGGCFIGGIVVNQQGNSIINCYNSGNLFAEGPGEQFEMGGIARLIVGNDVKIEKSYNSGDLTLKSLNSIINRVGRNSGHCI